MDAPPDPDKWYPLRELCRWFPSPRGGNVCAATLRTWCRHYGIVPHTRHGYFFLTGSQIIALLEYTQPSGGKILEGPRTTTPKQGPKRKAEIQAAMDFLEECRKGKRTS
jgi:hypothetical protein